MTIAALAARIAVALSARWGVVKFPRGARGQEVCLHAASAGRTVATRATIHCDPSSSYLHHQHNNLRSNTDQYQLLVLPHGVFDLPDFDWLAGQRIELDWGNEYDVWTSVC